MTKAVGLASLHDSTRLAGLARLSFDATKVAALENICGATKVAPGVAGLATSAKLAGLANLRDATKVAGLADLQKRFEKAGLTAASVQEQSRRLDRITNQAAAVERFERDQRMFEAMKVRNRIDDELRDLSLRQARRTAELEAAQLGTLDQLVALNDRFDRLNDRVDDLAEATAAVAEEERVRAERDRTSTRWLVWFAAATAILTAVVVGLTVALLRLTE